MARWFWWFIRSVIYSGIIFAFMYYFIYLKGIPNLWEGYTNIFTINVMIIVAIICGFIFSSVITFLFLPKKKRQ
jgi:hypothetical protein